MELKKWVNQSFYYDVTPMEQMKSDKLSPSTIKPLYKNLGKSAVKNHDINKCFLPKSDTTLIFAALCR
jgi:hypothetical protein